MSPQTWIFLILSGLATGASWLCYFRALQLGPVAKVAVIDKSSIVLTVLFAIVLLQETDDLAGKLIGIALIGAGTYLMVEWRDRPDAGGRGSWIVFAQDAQLGFTHASERSEEVGWWSSRSRGQGFPFCDRRYILDFSHVIVEGGHHGQVSCHLHRIPRHNRRGV